MPRKGERRGGGGGGGGEEEEEELKSKEIAKRNLRERRRSERAKKKALSDSKTLTKKSHSDRAEPRSNLCNFAPWFTINRQRQLAF